MQDRRQRWLDYTGLNLIRIVIGSYFMAIALDLIKGIDPSILFLSLTAPTTADLLGTMLLFVITAAFMIGVFLRLTSLTLALFVLTTSLIQNLVMPGLPEGENIGAFWRDLTLVCAILLSYTCLKRTELHKAALVWRRTAPVRMASGTVVPRRITTKSSGKDRSQPVNNFEQALKPLLAPKRGQEAQRQPNARKDHDEHDVDNIFAAI